VPTPDATLAPDVSLPSATLQGTFGGPTPCTAAPRPATTLPDGTPLFDAEACVAGGMFVFGSEVAFGTGDGSDVPQRAAILPPFLMDRYEVTVARFRDALSRGLSAADPPVANDAAISFVNASANGACTWSTAPMGRETLPLNCVSWSAARAFCVFAGGDLPTEAQREYVAMDAGRAVQTLYPWGEDPPTCQHAVYARQVNGAVDAHAGDCNTVGVGLPPADTAAGAGGDVALGTGIVDLAGSVSEILSDTFASLSSACWAAQPLESPSCVDPSSPDHSLRGGSWADNSVSLTGDVRDTIPASMASPVVGFRCVRPVP
jgi:formylglycine-generating enzyme required for sulfatase activity